MTNIKELDKELNTDNSRLRYFKTRLIDLENELKAFKKIKTNISDLPLLKEMLIHSKIQHTKLEIRYLEQHIKILKEKKELIKWETQKRQ